MNQPPDPRLERPSQSEDQTSEILFDTHLLATDADLCVSKALGEGTWGMHALPPIHGVQE